MIKVTVEFDPKMYDARQQDFSWLIEAIVGKVFSEEMDNVDVRIHEFQAGDESTFPMFITVDGDEHDIRCYGTRDFKALADVFHAAVEDGCRHYPTGTKPLPDFRVWVRSQPGGVSDPVRLKGNT